MPSHGNGDEEVKRLCHRDEETSLKEVGIPTLKEIEKATNLLQTKFPDSRRPALFDESKVNVDLVRRLASAIDGPPNFFVASELCQEVRSFKWRGAAYNMLKYTEGHPDAEEFVTASAGNHSQGVALAARMLGKKVTIFMPEGTPQVKIDRTQKLGGDFVTIVKGGACFDDAKVAAEKKANDGGLHFVHPYDDINTIIGQASLIHQVFQDLEEARQKLPDVILVPVGGGGLAAGIASYVHAYNRLNGTEIQVIGVEPCRADSMSKALRKGGPQPVLKRFDSKVDGAAVQTAGTVTHKILERLDVPMKTVAREQIEWVLQQYLQAGMDHTHIPEMAGAMALTGYLHLRRTGEIGVDQRVLCIESGGNIDKTRLVEIAAQPFEGFPRIPEHLLRVRSKREESLVAAESGRF